MSLDDFHESVPAKSWTMMDSEERHFATGALRDAALETFSAMVSELNLEMARHNCPLRFTGVLTLVGEGE